MQILRTETPVFSFKQNVADALVGLEDTPVELAAGTLNIQALAAGILIGTLRERLEGSQSFGVNLRGPIRGCIAGGAINAPAYVKMGATGLVAANSADKICGIAIYPFAAALNDKVSYIQFDAVMP